MSEAADSLTNFKENQKRLWAGFAAMENFTASAAPKLLRFARVERGQRLLDVGCGTGVVTLTAARLGANATGLDLTPELLAHARENATLMGLLARLDEGDVEALPFSDESFDVVVSQFGHMFAPRPELALSEMLRVLRRGGVLAFSTWPPDLFIGRMFQLLAKYGASPGSGTFTPWEWGSPDVIRSRLGDRVLEVSFCYERMSVPTLSIQHFRAFNEARLGPLQRTLEALDRTDPPRAQRLRREYDALVYDYFEDNQIKQDFLITRAIKN